MNSCASTFGAWLVHARRSERALSDASSLVFERLRIFVGPRDAREFRALSPKRTFCIFIRERVRRARLARRRQPPHVSSDLLPTRRQRRRRGRRRVFIPRARASRSARGNGTFLASHPPSTPPPHATIINASLSVAFSAAIARTSDSNASTRRRVSSSTSRFRFRLAALAARFAARRRARRAASAPSPPRSIPRAVASTPPRAPGRRVARRGRRGRWHVARFDWCADAIGCSRDVHGRNRPRVWVKVSYWSMCICGRAPHAGPRAVTGDGGQNASCTV